MSFHFSYLMKMNFRLIPSPLVQIILFPAAYGRSFLEEFLILSPELQLASGCAQAAFRKYCWCAL